MRATTTRVGDTQHLHCKPRQAEAAETIRTASKRPSDEDVVHDGRDIGTQHFTGLEAHLTESFPRKLPSPRTNRGFSPFSFRILLVERQETRYNRRGNSLASASLTS